MNRLRAILLACGVLAAVPALGASPDPKNLGVPPEELSKARELVRRMGSDSYREREDAQAELAKMGRFAKQALTEGATTETDPEIRSRAVRLLPKAQADDLKARVETFLEDKEGKFDHDLPGLKSFRKTVGATPKARELYVEILKSPYNLDMFAAMDRGNVEGGRAISDRRNTMWSDMQHRQFPGSGKPVMPKQPTLPDIAAILFAEAEVHADFIPKGTINWQQVSGVLFFNQGISMQAVNGTGAHHEMFKVIVSKWLGTRTDPTELTNLVYQLGNGNLQNFPETMVLLRRTVTTDGVQGYAKGQALNFIIQKRGKEEIPFLKSLLTNDTMVQQVWFGKPNGMAEMHSCLMKDVALAFLLVQAGQDMRSYGFETQPGAVINPSQLGFGQYAFTTEEKRSAAFVKYGWYQMKQSMKGPGEKDVTPKENPKPDPTIPPEGRPRPRPVLPPPPPGAPPVLVLPANPIK